MDEASGGAERARSQNIRERESLTVPIGKCMVRLCLIPTTTHYNNDTYVILYNFGGWVPLGPLRT